MTIQTSQTYWGVYPQGMLGAPTQVTTGGDGGLVFPCVDINVYILASSAGVAVGDLLSFDNVAETLTAGETFTLNEVNHEASSNLERIFGFWCVALEAGSAGDTIKARFQGPTSVRIFASGDSIAGGTPLGVAANADRALSPIFGSTFTSVTVPSRAYATVFATIDTTDADDDASAELYTVMFNGAGFAFVTPDTLLDEANQ